MPSVEEELFLADTQQARHQRVKRLRRKQISLFQSLHTDSEIG